MSGFHRLADSGAFGLTPLRAHVVIVGFPRAGSTMLYLMAHNCVRSVRVFRKEYFALRVAWSAWRNHAFIVTKKPLDTFWVDEIRDYYRTQPAECKFVVLVRDPRSVLTSLHEKSPEYFVSIERWKALYDHVEYVRQAPDAIVIDFNQLVTDCGQVQQRLEEFIGWETHRPFSEFHTGGASSLETRAMNGIRPLDPSAISKWRADKHRERIRAVLRSVPDLPEILIRSGYEQDDRWVESYV